MIPRHETSNGVGDFMKSFRFGSLQFLPVFLPISSRRTVSVVIKHNYVDRMSTLPCPPSGQFSGCSGVRLGGLSGLSSTRRISISYSFQNGLYEGAPHGRFELAHSEHFLAGFFSDFRVA